MLTERDITRWENVVSELGLLYLNSSQLETAKRYLLRALAWPGLTGCNRRFSLLGMAPYYNERKEWDKVVQCCEEALTTIPDPDELMQDRELYFDVRFLLLLADAAEGQADVKRAFAYDEKAKKLWLEEHETLFNLRDFVACNRRQAFRLLAGGRPEEAAQLLEIVPRVYGQMVERSGINIQDTYQFGPMLAALKVLAGALVLTESVESMKEAERIRADVAETEAIIAGYREGEQVHRGDLPLLPVAVAGDGEHLR